jgi:autotransporter-associated beta strand protein
MVPPIPSIGGNVRIFDCRSKNMSRPIRIVYCFAVIVGILSLNALSRAAVTLSSVSPYTESFMNDLGPATGAVWTTATPQAPIPGTSGWDGARLGGTGTSMPFNVDNGTSTQGALYSYGPTGSTDRAIGSIASGTNIGAFGLELVNNTGATISSVDVSYLGEFWRSGQSLNTLNFFYQVGTSGSGNYLSDTNDIPFSALNLVGPPGVASNGQLDGTMNNATFSSTIANLNWTSGTSLYLAWRDTNDSGNDAGLAVDNFSLTPHALVAAPTWTGGSSTDGNWSSAANWSIAPADGNNLVFTGSTRTTNTNNGFLHSVGTITFDSNASAFTLNGTDLSIATGVVNNSTSAQTININLALSTSQTFNAGSGNIAFGGTVSLGASTLTAGGPNNITFGGSVSGTGAGAGVAKIGAGTVTFNAPSNNIHGPLQITGGTVGIGPVAAVTADFGNTAITTWDGGLSGAGTFNLSLGTVIDGSGNLASQGTLQINSDSASAAYSGTANITGNGQLIVQSPTQPLGTAHINVLTNGLQISTSLNQTGDLSSNQIILGGDGVNPFVLYAGATFSNFRSTLILGPIKGTGSVYFQNNQLPGAGFPAGSPSTANGGGTVKLSGTSTYTGDTFINLGTSGVVQLLNDNALPTATNLTIGNEFTPGATPVALGGTLDLNGHNQTIASLATGAAATANPIAGKIIDTSSGGGTSTLTINGSATTTFAFPIQDGAGQHIALTRAGAGTTILTGTNTYSGPTTVSGGTLQIGTSGSLSSSSNLVMSGGTFSTGGNSVSLNTLTVSGSPAIDLGGAGTLTFTNSNTTINGDLTPWSGVLAVNNWSFGNDHLQIGSDATGLTTTQLGEIKFADFAQGASISSSGEVTPRIGDINQDGQVNSKDVSALMNALSNEGQYQTQHSFTATDLAFILDVDHDGQLNDLDVQNLISLLATGASGGGSLTAVPEPSSILLISLGGLVLFRSARRNGCSKR